MAQPRGKGGGIPRNRRQERQAALQFGGVHV
jgi:hypothetical protein